MTTVRNSIKIPDVVTPPTGELITVEDMKAWLKMDYSTDDTLIGNLIKTARQYAESFCSISIGVQGIQVYFTHDGEKPIKLPRGPVDDDSVQVEYKSCLLRDWTDVTGETDRWKVEGGMFIGNAAGYYRVNYNAGYDVDTCPQGLLDGLKTLVARLYEHRGDEVKYNLTNEDLSILNPYFTRIWV